MGDITEGDDEAELKENEKTKIKPEHTKVSSHKCDFRYFSLWKLLNFTTELISYLKHNKT